MRGGLLQIGCWGWVGKKEKSGISGLRTLVNCGTRKTNLRDKTCHPDFGHVEIEMAMRHLSENRRMDPPFRRKIWLRFESVRLNKKNGCLSEGPS